MANEIDSGVLDAALNAEVVNQALELAIQGYNGVIGTASLAGAERPEEGSKLNWLDYHETPRSSALTAGVNDSVTTIPVTAGASFRAGMQVSAANSDEVMMVTAVSGNNLTVTRGYGSTTAAAVTSGTELFIDSVAREENSLSENDTINQPETRENFFQTMDTALEFSRRALATLQYGNTNDLVMQLAASMRQLVTQQNRALIRGRKGSVTISGKARTTTGGIKYWIDQTDGINTNNSGNALTLTQIDNLSAQVKSLGGRVDTVAVGIDKARTMNALVAANYSSQRLADFVSDQGSLTRLPSDLPLVGDVTNIVIDTNIGDNELLMFDSSKLEIVPMAAGNADAGGAFRTLDATQPGQDGVSRRIVGDFGMRVRNYKTHMARLHNIA